jgi:hypothetical protein
MRQRTTRTGVFRDSARARRAIREARAWNFKGIHVVSDDPELRAELGTESQRELTILSLAGAAVGLLLGVAADPSGVLAPAGTILGAFLGAVLSRGITARIERSRDHEHGSHEILVTVEADSPARIAVAETILSDERVTVDRPSRV